MGGWHHAYNHKGRQYGDGPVLFKRGPRKPHQHKISHGYWELNPNYVEGTSDEWTRFRWVHHPDHTTPHIPNVPGTDDLTDLLTPTGIFNNPNPSNQAPGAGLNPMIIGVAALAFFLLRK